MILDERTEFGDAFSLIGNAATTYILGDVIDLGATPTLRNLGDGREIMLEIDIDTTVLAAGGAANITFKLVSDSTADLATSATTHWTSAALAKGTLVAGYNVVKMVLPHGNYERYLGVTFTPDTNNITAGKANAFLAESVAAYTAYPDAI
jgi:hypothetical protein